MAGATTPRGEHRRVWGRRREGRGKMRGGGRGSLRARIGSGGGFGQAGDRGGWAGEGREIGGEGDDRQGP
jgi:hypothetical protein